MSSYKTHQHHVIHRGRKYHFVSYEASQPNPKTGDAGLPATWYLIRAGKRWPAFPQLPDEDPQAVLAAFTTWLDDNVLAATPDHPPAQLTLPAVTGHQQQPRA